MLPPEIPIFPLPNAVLFPNVFLPLHIFEPRYRSMVSDALEGDRIIGMALLQPGWEGRYEGCPRVYPIGSAGLVSHVETLGDGRYNIILRGLEKYRIVEEIEPSAAVAYRRARIEALDEPVSDSVREFLHRERPRIEALLGREASRITSTTISDADLVNALAQYLDLEVVERQALLEREGLQARCQGLIDLLEMKLISARHGFPPGQAH